MITFLNSLGEVDGESLPEHLSFESHLSDTLSVHTREEIHQIATQYGKESQREFEGSLIKLNESIRRCSPIQLLCHFSYYDLVWGDIRSSESEYISVPQHGIELLQAVCLTIPINEYSQNVPSPEQRMEINQLLRTLGESFAAKRMGAGNGADGVVREIARLHTQIVRNPGTKGQIFRNLKELFAPLDEKLALKEGVTFTGLITVFECFLRQIIDRINLHNKSMQICVAQKTRNEMIEVFGKEFGLPTEEIQKLKDYAVQHNSSEDETKTGLLNYSEQIFHKMFSVNVSELKKMYPTSIDESILKKAFSKWSFRFGDLQGKKLEHLFLDNLVWSKPFIQISQDTYFCPTFTSVVSFGLKMMEAQMGDDKELVDAYHKRRAEYTESKTATLLADFVPNTLLIPNLEWTDEETGRVYENDLLLLVDTHAVIVECKSGDIKDSAHRGAESLGEHLRKLIQEPTEQGYRFETFLRKQTKPITLYDTNNVSHTIDTTRTTRFTRINVLLDFWGPLACQYKLLRESGILTAPVPPAVTMSIVDLENLLYLIESPSQRLHYLHTRSSIERDYEIIGDELDHIAYYLGGGRWPTDTKTIITLGFCSGALDPFLERRDRGLHKKVPALKLNKWWSDIISRAEAIRYQGWTETVIILLSFPYEQQEQYFDAVTSTLSEASNSPAAIEGKNIILASFSWQVEQVGIATHIVSSDDKKTRQQKMEQGLNALSNLTPKPNVGVTMLISPKDYPYTSLCYGLLKDFSP